MAGALEVPCPAPFPAGRQLAGGFWVACKN